MAATYTYKFRDKSGRVQEGELEDSSRAAVAKALRDRGYNPISVDEKKNSALQKEIKIPGFSDRIKVKDVAVFSRQFATMINSGLSLLRSLNILAEQTQNSALAKIILEVKAEVEKGATLSDAMAKFPKAFNTLYVAMVKAGEIGGVLDETLIRLADTIEAQVELRSKIRSAMMYPTAVMGLVLFIVTAMLIFIVPMFESLYADLGGSLPVPTKILLLLSEFITKFWYLAVLGSIGTVIAFKKWIANTKGRAQFDAIKLKLPVFGGLIHKTAIARFSHTLAALTRTGVPILQAMDIVAATSGNAVVARAVMDVQASIKEGESLSAPLLDHPVFPPMVVQMMAVGEETGALDTMLEKVGDFYDKEVATLLIVVLGITVGGMLVALYLPMFNVINLIE